MSEVLHTPELDRHAESLIKWGAARAGIIIVLPGIGGMALVANEIYMIMRLGKLYGVELSSSAVKGFVLGLAGAAIAGQVWNLIPIPPLQIAFGVGLTYGIGIAAREWIKDGMPEDVAKYKELYKQAKKRARSQVDEIKNDPRRFEPLGDEKVRF